MNLSTDYLDDILIRMAYHSSAIEGNTITLAETVSIILEDTIIAPEKGIKMREFYEVANHKQAFDYIISALNNDEPFTERVIKKIHELLLDRIQFDKGQYKATQNAIIGASFETAKPHEVPNLILQWVDNTLYRLEIAKNIDDVAEVLAESHIQFERIHPFSDGNGRTGRMINIFLALMTGYSPVVVKVDDRALYITLLSKEDVPGLAKLFKESMTFESERMTQFS
ncbi:MULTISPECIES: Fic family protein [Vagococcus]|uniref:Huntingtin interacting protein E-like protein n=1 Tax=Vagococcus fluvialis bH819 TaxID=1255619 RepID=A0A1X6WQM9_9ENTE|nr:MULTISPECIES: Fic family protein [Vagococcus]SLM86542.1 Huntingtin interacting protein E-like protein [Vagococcus fluvialis bH819]HCM90749.1 Fic family protein [Vagococcus sp.]